MLLGLACAMENEGADKQNFYAKESKAAVVNLHQLLKDQDKYKDQPVLLAAYFVTHCEGPWICSKKGDWRKRLETTLSIMNIGAAKLILLEPTRTRIEAKFGAPDKDLPLHDEAIKSLAMAEFGDGVPALISGTFRVGKYTFSNGLKLDNHPFIELTHIQEVAANDARWRTVQPEGEQPGAAQPATKPADKVPPKDQPSTPTSKDAPR